MLGKTNKLFILFLFSILFDSITIANEAKDDNNWHFHWYIGPSIGIRTYDQSNPFLYGTQAKSTAQERYIGAIIGGLARYNNWVFHSYLDSTIGKSNLDFTINDQILPINEYSDLLHRMFSWSVGGGYRIKSGNFSFMPGINNTFSYSKTTTEQGIGFGPFATINSIQQDISQAYVGLSQISTWNFNQQTAISLHSLLGYIYFHKLTNDINYSAFSQSHRSITNYINHRGYYVLLSMAFSYRSQYGGFLLIPSYSYSYIPHKSTEGSKLTTLSLRLVYLIGS
ncbi:hypothetical protein L3V82_04470 [Thiotrichales bacterium 19S3-7]|nr:hypothetical protein [Thiotrichales bacterium 19S3-7]MCF6801349.1 hypothetical protein [Thiotrichales bacterium 19S3-11]